MGLQSGASLATLTGSRHDVGLLRESMLDRLDEGYARLMHGGVSELECSWASRIGLIGAGVVVERMDGVHIQARLCRLSFGGVALEDTNGEQCTLAPEAIRHIQIP